MWQDKVKSILSAGKRKAESRTEAKLDALLRRTVYADVAERARQPVVIRKAPIPGDPFDRPRQVVILGIAANDGCAVRLDRKAADALRGRGDKAYELRVVTRYGGVQVVRASAAELGGIVDRIERSRKADCANR